MKKQKLLLAVCALILVTISIFSVVSNSTFLEIAQIKKPAPQVKRTPSKYQPVSVKQPQENPVPETSPEKPGDDSQTKNDDNQNTPKITDLAIRFPYNRVKTDYLATPESANLTFDQGE